MQSGAVGVHDVDLLAKSVLVAAAPVASISVAPDGRTFSTTGLSDGFAKLWSTATLEQFGASLPEDPGGLVNAAISSDGRNLVVIDDAGTAAVWPLSPDAWEQRACTVAGRNFTREEWVRFVPGRHDGATCPGFRAG